MSKKKQKSSQQGTYALCITVGLILGLGLGPLMGSVLVTALAGGLIGAGVAWYFNQRSSRPKR